MLSRKQQIERMIFELKRDGLLDKDPAKLCTCQWSMVNTTTEDPPHIININPDCPRHGDHR